MNPETEEFNLIKIYFPTQVSGTYSVTFLLQNLDLKSANSWNTRKYLWNLKKHHFFSQDQCLKEKSNKEKT